MMMRHKILFGKQCGNPYGSRNVVGTIPADPSLAQNELHHKEPL